MAPRYYEVDVREVAGEIREELESRERIRLAVLFGSILRRRFVRDVDVAVYAAPRLDLPEILELEGGLEGAVGVPVDLTPLERAAPEVRLVALYDGLLLVQRGIARSDLIKAALEELEGLARLGARPYPRPTSSRRKESLTGL